MTATADDVGAAFAAGLAKDADAAPPPETPAPPRRSDRDPEAPHGRADDGTPHAPYGLGQNGKPRIKPAGPGRAGLEKPRVTQTASPSAPGAGAKGEAADYTEDLMGLGTAVWLAASGMKGGKLGPFRLPDARPYAAVLHQQLPALAAAWNEAAKQDPAVRGVVEKFTGEGSKTWIIGVAVVTAGFVASCAELAKAPAEVRAQASKANDAALQQYIGQQVQAMGLEAAA